MTMLLSQMLTDSMNAFSKKLNFTLTTTTGELDADKYITNIQTMANNGEVDGFVAEIDPQVSTRINEVYQELKIPYICLFNSVRDDAGSEIMPCIGLDQKAAGATTIQWLYDNYKTYWGDIDTTKIALLDFTFSTLPDLQARADGAIGKFKELFPKNTQFFTADAAVTNTVDADSSYKAVSAIFSAHPEIEYWWVPCSIETFAQGTSRCAESLKIEDHVLITDVGSDVLCSEWQNSYDGCWVSCLAISNYLYAAPTVCGLIALIDGKATPESLWQKQRAPGDKCTFYQTSSQMVTKTTYKDYFNGIAKTLEFELPYPS
jgi:DNA-binding LacI/PurR family transcriptional regulator